MYIFFPLINSLKKLLLYNRSSTVQVSKLIILHEEGEDGNAMPDLEKPVSAVSTAVNNLVRVGHDTIASSQVKIRHFRINVF